MLDRQYTLAVQTGIQSDRETYCADFLYKFARFQREKNQQDLANMVQNAEGRTKRLGK